MIEGKILAGEDGKIVLPQVRKTETTLERTRGLLGYHSLSDGEGLLITPCSSIHTFFMQFPIDVIFLNRKNRIIKIIHSMRPFRISMVVNSSAVLELMAGQACRSGIRVGDKLTWDKQNA